MQATRFTNITELKVKADAVCSVYGNQIDSSYFYFTVCVQLVICVSA
jgi:hypothetical protein